MLDVSAGVEILNRTASGGVVDLAPHPNSTIVHFDVLPGAIDSYVALARRIATA